MNFGHNDDHLRGQVGDGYARNAAENNAKVCGGLIGAHAASPKQPELMRIHDALASLAEDVGMLGARMASFNDRALGPIPEDAIGSLSASAEGLGVLGAIDIQIARLRRGVGEAREQQARAEQLA